MLVFLLPRRHFIDISPKCLPSAAYAIADQVKEPNEDKIIPGPFETDVAPAVAAAVRRIAEEERGG
jgi:malate dehydrogenase (oxaloacetate-decarboxylating)